MGSNMAECHPVAFPWVMEARTRPQNPCPVIHPAPRFTRTPALAEVYAPLRAGPDIISLGALIRHALNGHERILNLPPAERSPRDRFFHDYLLHYTNAASVVNDDFVDTEQG